MDGVKKEKIAPAGLGDSVQAIAIALGIKRMVDWFNEKTGLDCGCETRRDYLNKRFRYGVMNGLCMTVQEFNAWEEFRMKPSTTIDREDAIMIANLHARLFSHKQHFPCTSCPRTWQDWVSQINTIYNSYKILEREELIIDKSK